ncbi:pilus assembly protein [Vandammella animalimorsus]|uniref:Fimbrial assembly protein n=1 Tax=Vandammella animalimorsus TaxID=2029117 RepID=A0A2A2AGK0_9BURK|nr:PilC/PilY family type IV pilus protein [Vandammella animalimorsus]PAT36884.1 fimbrial assembly protein [Vandammella animalimorsus]
MRKKSVLLSGVSFFVFCGSFDVAAQTDTALSQTPLFISESYPPLNMLVMGRDHKLYYEAYNDASDLDGDGVVDIGYKPDSIDYFGYFHNRVCYSHRSGIFVPVAAGFGDNGKQCGGAWSGDFLNYLATSRMDAIRKVLYGGYRVIDTADRTVLQTAFIPQDAHSWGKEYSPERDNFDIAKYAPLSPPASGRRHLFAVTTLTDNGIPRLRVLPNSEFRIWQWVSKQAPVAGDTCQVGASLGNVGTCVPSGASPIQNYDLRVEVCSSDENLRDAESCKSYPNNGNTVYKPFGLLHDFGENKKMYFGLLTGSYSKNIDGGVLRRNVGSFADEVDLVTGQFRSDVKGIVDNINRLRITGFDYAANPPQYRECGWITNGPINHANAAKCAMWGNPIGEMMFEALRYFSGASGGHSAFSAGSMTGDDALQLSKPAWISPYKSKKQGGSGYQHCARPAITVLSDINPSYDDKFPGSNFSAGVSAEAPELSGLNVATETSAIGSAEAIDGRRFFIGQSTSANADGAPTVKTINNLAWARGLAPEEPTKLGSYYAAGVARFGANNQIAGNAQGKNKVMTYSVAIASPLPEIRFPLPNGKSVVISPFAKTVGAACGSTCVNVWDRFQPTNQIVDYYISRIVNMPGGVTDLSVNSGRPQMEFSINFEDVEQGADHDMDSLVTYIISLNSSGGIDVRLRSEYAAGNYVQHAGYVISGTTQDGTYLEVRDTDYPLVKVAAKLNTPPGRLPGYCINTDNPGCSDMPLDTTRTFTPSASATAGAFLKDPLWYAAKYGMPGRDPSSVTGDPDNYFLVTNAGTLKEKMARAFNSILQTTNSVTAASVESSVPSVPGGVGDAFVYRTHFDVDGWAGDLIKEKVVRSTTAHHDERSQVWSAASKLANRASPRKIFFAGKNSHGVAALVPFTWGELNAAGGTRYPQWMAALNRDLAGVVDNKGKQRIEFLRGESHTFRERRRFADGGINILGDIVNSSALRVKGASYVPGRAEQLEGPGYVAFANAQNSQPEMVYVGANDGMLHAFDAASGDEVFAYIPSGVREKLNVLTDPRYGKPDGAAHRYFVDGKSLSTDVYFDGGWRKILIGTLGAGGRQIFALDITTRSDPKLLWEFGSDQHASMGFMAEPVIARLNDDGVNKGKWVALVAAGYQGNGSAQGQARLLVLDIKDGSVIRDFQLQGAAGMSSAQLASYLPMGNGLSRINAVDGDADGKVDVAYAGDIFGNVWRFDLKSGASTAWRADLLYVAKDDNGARQAVTAAPYIVDHPSGHGDLVVVATGRYLTLEDKGNGQQQTIYGIWDRYAAKDAPALPPTLPTANKIRSDLQRQSFSAVTGLQGAFTLSGNDVEWLPGGQSSSADDAQVHKWGWYVDLPEAGERVVYDMTLYGRGLFVTTIRNEEDPCKPGLSGRLIALDPGTGGETDYLVFDVNGDGVIDNNDQVNGEALSAIETGGPGQQAIQSEHAYDPAGGRVLIASGVQSGRQSWRKQPPNAAATTP